MTTKIEQAGAPAQSAAAGYLLLGVQPQPHEVSRETAEWVARERQALANAVALRERWRQAARAH